MNESLDEKLPDELNWKRLLGFEFWPRWDCTNTTNQRYVEPDFFMRFPGFDIIIEAKRYEDMQVQKNQYENQIQAYKNMYSEEKQKLIYIALADINENNEMEDVKVCKANWTSILTIVKEYRNRIEHSNGLLNSSSAIINILDDLIMAFAMYGFSTADWFEYFFKPVNIANDSLTQINQALWKQ